MEKITIKMLGGEYWYGGAVEHGWQAPYGKESDYEIDLSFNTTPNQLNPVFMSSKGRYLWFENGGKVAFKKGVIEIEAPTYELDERGKCLKDACLNACLKHYPPTGTIPNEKAFNGFQYCTWIAFGYDQNQENILSYARSLVAKGFKPGMFIIDDTWQEDYGVWAFHRSRFPDATAMIDELKSLGFDVVMWLVPYVSPDSAPYRALKRQDAFISDDHGINLANWWNGLSAALDMEKPAAREWLNGECERLVRQYGVLGFKLDGSDPAMYQRPLKKANEQSTNYIDAPAYDLKEARSCYKLGGKPILQRLNDKGHCWKKFKDTDILGLFSILPNTLTQGVTGYWYCCPDMVGGGMLGTFGDFSNVDYELVIRSCQASILMPMVQFSLDVWNKTELGCDVICKKAADLRDRLLPYIVETIRHASVSGEPVVRYMEYAYPHCGFEKTVDQFMLGDTYLVAPVLKKGARERAVKFPAGKWKDVESGEIYGGGVHVVSAPLDKLPVFERVE